MKGDDAGRTRRRKNLLAAALIFSTAGIFLAGLFDMQNFDVWWHLKTGELIIREGSIPDVDPFSYTVSGQPWITHEWLSEIILYLTQIGFGFSGLVYLKAIFLALGGGLLLSLSLRDKGTALPFLLLPLFLFPITLRPFVRPHTFTLFFTCTLLFFLYRYRDAGNRKILYTLPPMFLIWANIHSGVVIGLVIFASFLTGWEVSRRLFERTNIPGIDRGIRPLVWTFAACLAASLINPHHVEALVYPFQLARNPVFTRTIAELKSPFSPEYSTAFWQIGFFALVPVTAVTAYVTRRYRDLASIFPLSIFLALSFSAHRNVPIFAVVSLAYITVCLTGLTENREAHRGRIIPAWLLRFFTCVVPILTLILLIVKGAYMGNGDWRPLGVGVREENYPVGAYDFLEETGIDGNMCNKLAFGGYLIYRGHPVRKVFIDGRLLLYGDSFNRSYLDAYYGSVDAEGLVRRHDIDYFLLDYPDETDHRMLQYYLSKSPDWKLVYWDDNSLIYIRNDPSYRSIIEEHAYNNVDPVYRSGFQVTGQVGNNPEYFIKEVERQLALRPATVISRVFLGTAYEKTGRIDEAIEQYEIALHQNPSRKDLEDKLFFMRLGKNTADDQVGTAAPSDLARGMKFLSSGQFEKARDALTRAASKSPDDANAHYNLALAYRNLGDRVNTRLSLEKAIAANHGHTDAQNDLGILYGMEGRYTIAINYIETASKLDPDNTSFLYNLAIAYDGAGKKEMAQETLRKILEIDPGHTKAKKRLEGYGRK